MASAQFGVQRAAADYLVQSAALGGIQAQQAYVIDDVVAERIVGVKSGLGAGDGKTRAVANVFALVADVVKERSLYVLIDGPRQELADEPVADLKGVVGVALGRRL